MIRLFVALSLIATINAQFEAQPLYRYLVEDVSHIRPLNDEEYLLPGSTVPHKYDVQIWTKIDEGEFDFNGEVTITIEAIADTSTIVLHHRNLTIDEVQVFSADHLTEYDVVKSEEEDYNEHLEFYTITLADHILVPGDYYQVYIKYSGELRGVPISPTDNDEAGFYRGFYLNDDGEKV